MIINKEIIYFLLRQPPLKLTHFILDSFFKVLKEHVFIRKVSEQKIDNTHINISFSYLKKVYISPSFINKKTADYLFKMFMEHRFNLLGSGWVKNSYSSTGLGVAGHLYNMNLQITEFDKAGEWLKSVLLKKKLDSSKRIWAHISDKSYSPIDWQKDYKCNFRWNQKLSFDKQRQLTKSGADIKVPWELSRMQHMPQMASFAIAFPEIQNAVLNEFRNQVLDFIATNPMGMGANWNCTMDIGIRAANILVAFDLLKTIDKNKILDLKFQHLLANAMYEHGRFITSHLEYSILITSNHYLSNICGLLFIASYLNESDEINCWLAFSVQEFFNEFEKQFYQDGSNFETSTSYHKLSGELVTYGLALIKGLGKDKRKALYHYKPKYWINKPSLKELRAQRWRNGFEFITYFEAKLLKILQFDESVSKPNGKIIQIGDNDNGKFFSFTPIGTLLTAVAAEKKYKNLAGYTSFISTYGETVYSPFWDEDNLNHQTFQNAINGLIINPNSQPSIESTIIRNLCNKNLFKKDNYLLSEFTVKPIDLSNFNFKLQKIFKFENSIDISNLEQHFYPDFGLFILRNSSIFTGIYTGSSVANGLESHSHNDKLSVFLTIDGIDILTDPGTYLYTPDPDERNRYRSSFSHNVPIHNNSEQEGLENGLFQLIRHHKTNITKVTPSSISVFYKNKTIKHLRTIKIESDQFTISDLSNTHFRQNFISKEFLFSNGYGKQLNK